MTEGPTDMQYGKKDLLAGMDPITLVYKLDTQPAYQQSDYLVLWLLIETNTKEKKKKR